jgi:hypothetical protein
MKVSIKDLNVSMEVKNKGIELDVYDGSENHLGDLVVAKGGLTWCAGRVRKENGIRVSWNEFIDWMQSKQG